MKTFVSLPLGVLVAVLLGISSPLSAERGTGSRPLAIAVVQMPSQNGAIAVNLQTAQQWLDQAAAAGADLVLYPEFMPTGYDLTRDIWKAAETMHGPTVTWMRAQAAKHGIWIGTTFLEQAGSEYYNSFVLVDPRGEIAGKVRKEVPAGAEANLFQGEINDHYIDTDIGRIGVMICYENYLSKIANKIATAEVDLLLMPFSFPIVPGGSAQPHSGTDYVSVYSDVFGVPVAAVNKVGEWQSGIMDMPGVQINGEFPGLSAIANYDGNVVAELDGQAGYALGRVELNSSYRRKGVQFSQPFVLPLIQKPALNPDRRTGHGDGKYRKP